MLALPSVINISLKSVLFGISGSIDLARCVKNFHDWYYMYVNSEIDLQILSGGKLVFFFDDQNIVENLVVKVWSSLRDFWKGKENLQ